VARLIPAALPKSHRELGIESEHLKIAEGFDAPLPENFLTAFLVGQKRQKSGKP